MEKELKNELSNLIRKEIRQTINSKVDLNELDEISSRLEKLKRTSKVQRLWSLILVGVLGVGVGYGVNTYQPLRLGDPKFKVFKEQGVRVGEDDIRHYIIVPENLKFQQVKGGWAVVIEKTKNQGK